MSRTVLGNVQLHSTNNENFCDSESVSSIEDLTRTNQNIDDSDSDAEDVIGTVKYTPPRRIELAIRNSHLQSCSQNQSCIPHQNNDSMPNIGSISMQNSANPMFGNKTILKGPVTINNFIADENSTEKWKKTESQQYESAEFAKSNTNQQSTNGLNGIIIIIESSLVISFSMLLIFSRFIAK